MLEPFEARVAKDGDRLLIQAIGGLNTHLEPGDCLILRDNSLGILRVPVDSDVKHESISFDELSCR